MPRRYPAEVRRQVIELARSGTKVALLLAAGADVPYVMAQAGHSDPKMTLGLYAKVIASRTDHGASLDKLVKASTDLGSS